MLALMIDRLACIVGGEQCIGEMTSTNVFDRTLGQQKFIQYLTATTINLLKQLEAALTGNGSESGFVM